MFAFERPLFSCVTFNVETILTCHYDPGREVDDVLSVLCDAVAGDAGVRAQVVGADAVDPIKYNFV